MVSAVASILVTRWRALRVPRPGLREGALALMAVAGVISSLVNGVPASTIDSESGPTVIQTNLTKEREEELVEALQA